MAEGAQRVLGADVAVSITGVAGPDEQEGQPVGTVWYGIAIPGHDDRGGHRPAARSTASASASSPPSRCSTCCGCGCWPWGDHRLAPRASWPWCPPGGARVGPNRSPNRCAETRRRLPLDATGPAAPHGAVPGPGRRIGRRFAHRIGRRIGPTDPAVHPRARRWGCVPVARGGRRCCGSASRRVLRSSPRWPARSTPRTAPLGFEADDRPFRAHLTLARVNRAATCARSSSSCRPVQRDHRSPSTASSCSTATPRPEGAVHTEQRRFALGGASSLRGGTESGPC